MIFVAGTPFNIDPNYRIDACAGRTYFRIYTGVLGMQPDISSGYRDLSSLDMQGL